MVQKRSECPFSYSWPSKHLNASHYRPADEFRWGPMAAPIGYGHTDHHSEKTRFATGVAMSWMFKLES